MSIVIDNKDNQEERFNQSLKRALYCLPLYALVPFLCWFGFNRAGYEMEWKAFGLGALGWFIALMLRGPVSAIVMKMPKDKAKNVIIISSGVLEESTRLVLLALTSVASSWAISIGQGWAAIEVVFVIINVIVIYSLGKRTDEKAMEAKELLEAQGTLHVSPVWGVLERIWASLFHIGCTLIVAHYAWTLVLLIPLHSSLNWFGVRLAARSVGISNLFIAAVSVLTLTTGLMLI